MSGADDAGTRDSCAEEDGAQQTSTAAPAVAAMAVAICRTPSKPIMARPSCQQAVLIAIIDTHRRARRGPAPKPPVLFMSGPRFANLPRTIAKTAHPSGRRSDERHSDAPLG